MISEEKLNKLRDLINSANNIVVISGAGISTPSGIPDIRGSNGAANNKDLVKKYGYSYETIVSHSFFMARTEEFYRYYKEQMIFKDAKPNAAHKWLASLEKNHNVTIITQNIDGLHIEAGSTHVIEFHGSVKRNHCLKCGTSYPLNAILEADGVPHCKCGGIIKPDVVLFEEGIDQFATIDSIQSIQRADLLLVIGSSLQVYPAAGLVEYYRGNNSILINKDPTPLDPYFSLVIHDNIVDIITKL